MIPICSRKEGTYSVLINDVDDHDKPSILLAVVDEGDPPDLNVSLERLHIKRSTTTIKFRGYKRQRGAEFERCR